MKNWYLSKTIWVNLIAFLAMQIQSHYGFVISAEEQTSILAAINLVLRFFTKASITTPTGSDVGKLMLLGVLMGAMSGCAVIQHSMNPDTPAAVLDSQKVARRTVYAFESAFKATPGIVDALMMSGKITPHVYNVQVLPAYNAGLAALVTCADVLDATERDHLDPSQSQAYLVALSKFLTQKQSVDNLLAAFGGAK